MKVIIDTNIYLNFFRLNSGQSLDMLKNLNSMIDEKVFDLILPKQIEDEFIRNKNSSVFYDDHILEFDQSLKVKSSKIPYLIKSSRQAEQIKNTVKKLNSLRMKAVEEYKKRIFDPSSRINKSLDKLFSLAIIPEETDVILQKAWFRMLKGNPPKKDNSSFGDAIIWETVLSEYIDDDLVIVTGDKDFGSQIEKNKINEFLLSEWEKKSTHKIYFYKELSLFINKHSKNKKEPPIKEEIIKEEIELNTLLNYEGLIDNNAYYSAVFNRNTGIENLSVNLNEYTLLKNKCSCCGVEIEGVYPSSRYSIMLGEDRCNDCKGFYDKGYNCSKCGKHFHKNLLNYNSMFYGNYFVGDLCHICSLIGK